MSASIWLFFVSVLRQSKTAQSLGVLLRSSMNYWNEKINASLLRKNQSSHQALADRQFRNRSRAPFERLNRHSEILRSLWVAIWTGSADSRPSQRFKLRAPRTETLQGLIAAKRRRA